MKTLLSMLALGFALNSNAQEACSDISNCKNLEKRIQARVLELEKCAKESKAEGTVRDQNGCAVRLVFSSELIRSIKASPKYTEILNSGWILSHFGSAISDSEVGAVEYCAGLGMRLPTQRELNTLYSDGNLEGYKFWASDSINSTTSASTYRALTLTDTVNNFGRLALGDSSAYNVRTDGVELIDRKLAVHCVH